MNLRRQHPSLERLSQYCEGALDQYEGIALEDHFAGCEACLETVQRMNALLFDGFSAEAHAAALRAEVWAADPLAAALRRAAELCGQHATVIRQWLADAAALWGEFQAPLLGDLGFAPVSGAAEAPCLRVELEPGTERAEISARHASQTVEIATSSAAALAVLFEPDAAGMVKVAAFEPGDGARVARFDNIPRGDYRLALSPERQSGPRE